MIKKKVLPITIFGTLSSKLILLAVLGYPARVLGPDSFGVVVTAASVTAYIGVLLWPGISNWGTMEMAREPRRSNQIVSSILAIRSVLALLGLLAISIFAYYTTLLSFAEKQAVFINALVLLSLAINTDWVFNGKELSHYPALISLLVAIINVILILSLINGPADALMYIGLIPTMAFFYSIILVCILRHNHIKFIRPKFGECAAIFRESLNLGLSGAMIVLLQYSTSLFVRGNLDTVATGMFGAAFYLFQLSMLIPSTMNSALMGRYARISYTEPLRAGGESNTYFEIYAVCGLTVSFITYLMSNKIIDLIYGSQYKQAAELIRIMSVGIFFNFCIAAIVGFLSALNKGKEVLLTVAFSLVTTIVIGGLLVPRMGLPGAAITVSIIDGAGLLVAIRFIFKIVPGFNVKPCVFPIAATLISALILQLLNRYYTENQSIIITLIANFVLMIIPIRRILIKTKRGEWFGPGLTY